MSWEDMSDWANGIRAWGIKWSTGLNLVGSSEYLIEFILYPLIIWGRNNPKNFGTSKE